MNIKDRLIHLEGKLESMMLTESSIRLMGKACANEQEFNETWSKTISLTTTDEIDYTKLNSITFDHNDDEIAIGFKSKVLIPMEHRLTFQSAEDREAFFQFLVEEQGFNRTDERLSPMSAILPYLGGLAITIVLGVLGYNTAIEMQNPNYVEEGRRKMLIFNKIVGFLGPIGVIGVATIIALGVGYFLYKAYQSPTTVTTITKK